MLPDERERQELYRRVEATMGRESADTLMSLSPPVGWAEVATRQDVLALDPRFAAIDARFDAMDARFDTLETSLDLRFEATEQRIVATVRSEMNGLVLKMFAMVVALVPALVVPLVTLR